MGHIKEPDGVDLTIGPSKITEKEKKIISWVIQYYKRTGKMPTKKQIASCEDLSKPTRKQRTNTRVRPRTIK